MAKRKKIAKPAREMWCEIGNRNGEVFTVKSGGSSVYYRQAYHNDYGVVEYQHEGEIPIDVIPDVNLIPGWRFDMPPIQGPEEKPLERTPREQRQPMGTPFTFIVPTDVLLLIEQELDRLRGSAPNRNPDLTPELQRGLALEYMAVLSGQTEL